MSEQRIVGEHTEFYCRAARIPSARTHVDRLMEPRWLCAVVLILFALVIPCTVEAQTTCNVWTPGGQSLGWIVTDRSTGTQLHNGSVVKLDPTGSYVDFHQWATAYGSCTLYMPDCSTYLQTQTRDVNHIATGMNGGSLGNIFGRNPSTGTTAFYQSLDDSDSAHSSGPIASPLIISPGLYTFWQENLTDTTACNIQPATLTNTMTVSYMVEGKNLGCETPSKGGQSQVGDPCEVTTGNAYQREVDYESDTLPIVRHYNSLLYVNVGLGVGWTTAYHRRLEFQGTTLRVRRADGKSEPFTFTGGAWQGDADTELGGVTQDSTGYTVTVENGDAERYDLTGRILSVTSPSGRVWTWSYDPSTGLLSSVTDSFGNSLGFQYSSGLLQSVTLPSGNQIQYAYDSNANLISATYPDGSSKQYLYEGTSAGTLNELTGIKDESGARYATYAYSSSQVSSSQLAGGAGAVSLTYNSFWKFGQVTDAFGVSRRYTYQTILSRNVVNAISGTSCPSCGATAVTYDANANATSKTDFNGNVTCYAYDTTRNLETTRVEGFAPYSSCPSNLATYTPASGTRQRKIVTTWNTTFRLPATITEQNRTTSFAYDSSGNMLSKSITDTSVSPNVSRAWVYTYDSYGHVLTAKGPRTDVNSTTTYTYYTCTTGSSCGHINTIADAVGNVTTYNSYNSDGLPTQTTSPSGVVRTMAYDLRQRLTDRCSNGMLPSCAGGELTHFDYWSTGLLKKVTLPDGSYLQYTYDAAHRLTQIADGLGNKVVYTLDAMGNRTAENTYDPSSTLHRTHSRVINTLNELYQDVNAAGTAAVTTTFGYDNNGNQTSISAPLSRNTANTYDELNRLKQVTDPGSGVTQFGYDPNDNLTSVKDPRNFTTSYTYNGFGDALQQVSPDTGTTANTYDSAGNVATLTDARGAVATYTYDALNRVTSVAYAKGGTTDQTVTFTYDAGTYGKGHRTGASDANHSMAWVYDAFGRVTGKTQTVGTVSLPVGYGYINGNLASITTPSGQSIVYGYGGNHQITSITVNGTTVLNGVTYEPLGPINGWNWGNGTTTSRVYDTDWKITQITSAGIKSYTYDNAFRITGISDTTAGSSNWTYGYDALDRLTSGASPSITRGWTYDADGNRMTETGSAPSTYTITSTSNRIGSITGALARTYTYDAAGNTTGYSTVAAAYNDAGRLQGLSNGSVTEAIVYNALGQRAHTAGGPAGTLLYAYDEAGHLLGEYDGSGNLLEETVWLGDTPVATLRPGGSTVSIYYVHTDQLNTPRQVTRPADNAQMWTWFSDPFGTDAANSNPAGAGAFAYDQRFPGQIFDGTAGLHYNWLRDYDPTTGRYVEADPIGQHTLFSISTLPGASQRHRGYWNQLYNYVDDSPLYLRDPTGLSGPWDWLLDIFKDKAPEVITPMFIGQGLAALCITQHCGQQRGKIELEGDCAGILAKWINTAGAQFAGMAAILTNDTQVEVLDACAELCEKGIKSKCCSKR